MLPIDVVFRSGVFGIAVEGVFRISDQLGQRDSVDGSLRALLLRR